LLFRQATNAMLDWFIPNAAMAERSEVGLARNFIATHLFGPILILSIVGMVYLTDPTPGLACWAMMACVGAFWLLPIGLKLTQDLQLMALVSVELLCVLSLIGSSFYGGVNSPFLPWLLVSLMLGFFYLSDHALRIVALFAFNIVATICAHVLYRFPQDLSPLELTTISWFSVFSATAYMSLMAIYYAGIVTMSSNLERETERHRLLAHRLRRAKRLADTASHGKTVFLSKMRRQFEHPLGNIVAASQVLIERLEAESATGTWKAEVERINRAGRHLLELVQDTVDPNRMTETPGFATLDDLSLDDFIDRLAAASIPIVAQHGHDLLVEKAPALGTLRVDAGRLRQALDILIAKAAAIARPGNIRLVARRDRKPAGDWVEFRIRTPSLRISRPVPDLRSAEAGGATAHADADLETSQMHFAVLGGSFSMTREADGGARFSVEVPASPIERLAAAA
jgi:signal transduction histidine kinase